MQNLGFLELSLIGFVQLVTWMVNGGIVYMYYWRDDITADHAIVYSLILCLFLRITSISGKYSTFEPNHIKLIKCRKISRDERKDDLMLIGWISQSDKKIKTEINNSLVRIDIDRGLFYLRFETRIKRSILDELIVIAKQISTEEKSTKYANHPLIIMNKGESEQQSISGILLFRYLLISYRDQYSPVIPFLHLLGFVIGIVYGLSVGLIRVWYDEIFHGETTLEIILFYARVATNTLMIYAFWMFFVTYLIDMNRKDYLLEQLGTMLIPRFTKNLLEEQILPQINLNCNITLRSWMILRYMTRDYGKKYTFRHEIYLPAVVGACFVTSLIFGEIFIFGYVTHEITLEIKKLGIFCAYSMIFLFILILIMLFSSGRINSHLADHSKKLMKIKQAFEDLLGYKEYYFSKLKAKEISGSKTGKFMRTLPPPEGTVHNRIAEKIIEKLRGFDTPVLELENELNSLKDNVSTIIDRLEVEETYHHFTLLGWEIDEYTWFSFAITCLSIGLTLNELFGNNN